MQSVEHESAGGLNVTFRVHCSQRVPLACYRTTVSVETTGWWMLDPAFHRHIDGLVHWVPLYILHESQW